MLICLETMAGKGSELGWNFEQLKAMREGVMKKEISRQVKVRHIPELIFKIDHSMDYGRHIEEILDTIDFDSYQKDEEEAEDADEKGEF